MVCDLDGLEADWLFHPDLAEIRRVGMRVVHPFLVVKDVRLAYGLPLPVQKLVAILVGAAQPENDVVALVWL